MDALLRRLIRSAMRRGMAGDWVWLALAGSAFVLRRVLSDKGGVISTVKVEPGEQLLITVRDRNTPPMAVPVLAPVSADET
ncbi:MAG TPA: hypothetical protein VHV57_04600 [Acidimicrobiales bacterium]|jgi:hypothetical protein|nr:hypothetical protein [Acidimicrobiales bacterium]